MKLQLSLFLATLAAFLSPSVAKAALVTYTDPAAYMAQLATLSLTETNLANFDSTTLGGVDTAFLESGIQFTSPNAMRIANGTTSSGTNFLGFDNVTTPDFQTGDQVTLTLPANSRAVRLSLISETIPDALAFASLTVDGQSVNSVAGGVPLGGDFRSYFLGIINDSSAISSAVLDFAGSGIAFYRVDDVGVASLTSIPEPNSLLLVAVGLVGFSRRRSARNRD